MKLKEAEKELGKLPVAMQLLVDPASLRENIKGINKEDRGKIVAYLCSTMKMSEVATLLGMSFNEVRWEHDKHRDILDYAKLARAGVVIELCQRKAIDMLKTFNPEEVPQEKRPQAIKFLIETADKSAYMAKLDEPENEKTRSVTRELIFRVTERMQKSGETNAEVEGKVIEEENGNEERDI